MQDQLMRDLLFNFSFKGAPLRGSLVQTHISFHDLTTQHGNQAKYPLYIKNLLGEMNAILLLMSSNLKIDGKINLQIRGDGHLYSVFTEVQLRSVESDMSVVDADKAQPLYIRGLARRHDKESQPTSLDLRDWVGKNATLAISLLPETGQPYQGIIPVNFAKLTQCIEDYYLRSEQIPTFFWTQTREDACAAIMVQHVPGSAEEPTIDMETAQALIHTLAPGELIETAPDTILHRLFHEFPVQHHLSRKIQFKCSCTKERMLNTLISLGEEEIKDMAKTMPVIEMSCQFCGRSQAWEPQFVLDYLKQQQNQSNR